MRVNHIANGPALCMMTCWFLLFTCIAHSQSVPRYVAKADSIGLMHADTRTVLLGLDSVAQLESNLDAQYEANYRLGKYFLLRMDAANARLHLQRAANTADELGDYERMGFALDRIGIAYSQSNLLDSALLTYQRTISIYLEHGLEHRLWTPYQGISRVYQREGDLSQAMKYGESALASLEGFDEPVATTIVLNHLLSLAAEAEDFERYSAFYERYLSTLDPSDIGTDSRHITAFFNTGSTTEDRLAQLQRAIADLENGSYTLSLLSAYYELGQTYMADNQPSKAIQTWQRGIEIDKQTPEIGFQLAFTKAIADAHAQSGSYQPAYRSLNDYYNTRDSLQELSNAQALNDLQLKYETALKEQTIIQQELELKEKSRNERALLFGLFALLALATSIFFAYRNRIKLQKMESEQREAEHQREVQAIKQKAHIEALNAMISAQEQERKRIAYDLHDQLGGLLTSIKLQLQDANKEQSSFKHLTEQVDIACGEVRKIAHDMMPHALLRMGLDAAIGDMVDVIQHSSPVNITYQNLEDTNRLSEKQQINIYRIVHELLQNTIKHAEADNVLIQFSGHNGTSTLVVEDDGKGFDPHSTSDGLGMQSVRNRVEFLNGEISIDSSPSTGTSISIDIPVAKQNS